MENDVKWMKRFFVGCLMVMMMVVSGCGTGEAQKEESEEPTSSVEVSATDGQEDQEQAPVKEETEAEKLANSEKPTNTAGTTEQIPVTLVRVVDGDTIKIQYDGKEQNVRYLLVDTPETNHPRLGKQPFGEEAKERNDELIHSGELSIEFDVGERVDKYGRLLAYVYVDGKSVQETLLEEGLARVAYVYPPNTRHLTPFEEVQAKAKQEKRGIWSIEDYSTDRGFNAEVVPEETGNTAEAATTEQNAEVATDDEPEYFKNCTELRKKYPNGVPSTHPAYQAKMDRDKDDFACER